MSIKMTALVVGKTKKAIQETDSGYNLIVNARERHYNKATKTASFQPTSVLVSLYGKLSDSLKAILNNEGVAVIITGEIEKTVAMKDGKPLVYTTGDRKGEFMYDLRMRTSTSEIMLAPKTVEDETATAAPKPAAVSKPAATASSDDSWV